MRHLVGNLFQVQRIQIGTLDASSNPLFTSCSSSRTSPVSRESEMLVFGGETRSRFESDPRRFPVPVSPAPASCCICSFFEGLSSRRAYGTSTEVCREQGYRLLLLSRVFGDPILSRDLLRLLISGFSTPPVPLAPILNLVPSGREQSSDFLRLPFRRSPAGL